jgi:hypothetical protein
VSASSLPWVPRSRVAPVQKEPAICEDEQLARVVEREYCRRDLAGDLMCAQAVEHCYDIVNRNVG